MNTANCLWLRDRAFAVKRATVTRHQDIWSIEIDTESQEYDGENWAPSLYHQGLRLQVQAAEALQGQTLKWNSSTEPVHEHPELGIMYVFGHHEIRISELNFGKVEHGQIELDWSGECDVYWDDKFHEGVPFRCKCTAQLIGADRLT